MESWNILLYKTNRGESPVKDFITTLESATIAKVLHTIDLLKAYGNSLGMPHSKRLVSDLYELRIRGKEEVRIIYSFKRDNVYLLHAFKKKSQKTPPKEISIARDRLKEI